MSTAILCLGNEIVGDDGVGIRVGRVIASLPLPPGVELLVRPNLGFELLELLESYDRLVIVDAMTCGKPAGSCELVEIDSAASMGSCPSCAHSIGISEILQIVRRLHPALPPRAIRIVGIEAQNIDMFGVGLSASVADALPRAVQLALEASGADSALVERGRAVALSEAQAGRTLLDVIR